VLGQSWDNRVRFGVDRSCLRWCDFLRKVGTERHGLVSAASRKGAHNPKVGGSISPATNPRKSATIE
jgi:hypothetical protein